MGSASKHPFMDFWSMRTCFRLISSILCCGAVAGQQGFDLEGKQRQEAVSGEMVHFLPFSETIVSIMLILNRFNKVSSILLYFLFQGGSLSFWFHFLHICYVHVIYSLPHNPGYYCTSYLLLPPLVIYKWVKHI